MITLNAGKLKETTEAMKEETLTENQQGHIMTTKAQEGHLEIHIHQAEAKTTVHIKVRAVR